MKSINEDLTDSIMGAGNLFDIYVHLYRILKCNLSDLKMGLEKEYDEAVNWVKELISLHDQEDFSVDINERYKGDILKLVPKEDKYECLSFLKLFFEKIDEMAGDKYYLTSKFYMQEDDGDNIELNHLNKEGSLEMGSVFYQQHNVFEEIIDPEDRFKLEKDIGETIETYQTNLLIKEKESSDTKTNLFRVTDKYINRKIKKNNNSFKIALIPFSNDKKILKLDNIKRNGKDHIVINGINQEDKYIKLVGEILEELIKEEVDIVIFPEMVFTHNMIRKVKEILSENWGRLLLVVCGSVWEDRTNTCITLGGNGREIGRQNKLNRYSEKEGIEDINLSSDEKIINVYDIEGFGRLCTPICVDFITEDYFVNIVNIGVNMCLLPTYTSSLKVFKDKASSLGSKNFGAVFLSNYCGEAKKSEIAFAYMPKKGHSFYPIICEKRDQKECQCNFPKEGFIIEIIE